MTAGASPTPEQGAEGPSTPPDGDAVRWRALLAVPIALAAVFAGIAVFSVARAVREALVSAPVNAPGFAGVAVHGEPPLLTFLSTLTQDLVLVIGVGLVVAAASGGRLSPAALGLRRPAKTGTAVGLVIGAYLLFLVVAAAWTSALDITDRQNIPVDLGTRDSTAALIGAVVLVCAVAPIAEEIFFRGFLFRALRRHGLIPAAAISGVVFGLAHVASSPIGFIVPLALLGVLLCLLYERTRSLYPSIALHCLNNSIAFGIGDGRGWLVPVCLLGAGAVIVVTVRSTLRVLAAPATAR